MREVVKVTYDGIEITYVEGRNVWTFELRGRERSAESLAKAKEVIDKPDPKEKKPFTRITVYLADWEGTFIPVEVTSIAESLYHDDRRVWISRNGQRAKEPASSLYLKTPANEEKIAKWRELQSQASELDKQMKGIVASMQKLEVEP